MNPIAVAATAQQALQVGNLMGGHDETSLIAAPQAVCLGIDTLIPKG